MIGAAIQFGSVFAGFIVAAYAVRWTIGRDTCGPVAAEEPEDV